MGSLMAILYRCNANELCRITPWVTNMGLQNAFIVAAFAGLAQALTFLIFVRYGRALRKSSVHKYQLYVKEMASAGMVS